MNYDEMQLLLLEGIEQVIKTKNEIMTNTKCRLQLDYYSTFCSRWQNMMSFDLCRDFTVTWRCVLKLPMTILFAQQLIVLNYKETIESHICFRGIH